MTDSPGPVEKASGGALAAAAALLLSIGAANAALAMTVETCTQGGADSLYGGFITLVFYLLGIACLAASRPGRPMLVALLPAIAAAAWHSGFAIRFAAGYWLHDMSACFAMTGGFTPADAGEWMDGGEPLLTALWLGLSLLFWIGIVLSFLRARRPA